MSKWGEIEGVAGDLLRTGIEDVASWAVKKLRGDATDDTAKEMIEAIVMRAVRASISTIEDELRAQADRFGLAVALTELGPLTEGVLKAFETKPTGGSSFGSLEAEQMPDDWHPGDEPK